MSTHQSGIRVSVLHGEHQRSSALDIAARKQASSDGLPERQLARILAPLDSKIRESFGRAERAAVAVVAVQAEAAEDLTTPSLGAQAALRDPVRVDSLMGIAASAPVADLRRMAGFARKYNDVFAILPIMRALSAGDVTDAADLEYITSQLSKIGEVEREAAVADFVAGQSELARMRCAGPYGDGEGVTGAKMLEAASDVGRVPDGKGGFRQLGDAEISACCEAAGVPRRSPSSS